MIKELKKRYPKKKFIECYGKVVDIPQDEAIMIKKLDDLLQIDDFFLYKEDQYKNNSAVDFFLGTIAEDICEEISIDFPDLEEDTLYDLFYDMVHDESGEIIPKFVELVNIKSAVTLDLISVKNQNLRFYKEIYDNKYTHFELVDKKLYLILKEFHEYVLHVVNGEKTDYKN